MGARDVTVRAAVQPEVEAIVALWSQYGGPTRTASGRPEADRLLDRDPGGLLVAVIANRVVGTLVVGWDGWRCHLYRLVVDPTLRRQGVARLLVAAARERCSALGASRLDAMVDPDNDPAVSFWTAEGFELDVDRRYSSMADA